MTNFVNILDAIEENLTQEIDVNELAKKARMSVYEFRRIFSFVVGVPIGEYVRKRRLSAAAADIVANGISVTEAAMKYQYDEPSSFARAFKEFHGVSPSELAKGKAPLKMYTRVDFQLRVNGGNSVEYRIYHEDEFFIQGVKGVSKIEGKECCEEVWETFESSPLHEQIEKTCNGKIYASYENVKEGVECCIGRRETEAAPTFDCVKIPHSTWVAFTLNSTEDEFVNAYYGEVICKWLNSGMYCRNEELPNLEIFPVDMSSDDFSWEIHVPIQKK